MKRVRLLFMLALVALVVAACGTVAEPFVLTAVINGNGTIEVGAPVNTTLSATKKKTSINSGTKVTLTAKPAAGWQFDGWAGACSGTNATCNVTMDAAKSVTATFTEIVVVPDTFTVTFSVTGSGKVHVMPNDVDKLNGETLTDVPAGTELVLTAVPDNASTNFTSWTGTACESETTDTCTVTINADTTIGVTFTTLGNYNLSVSFVQGLGSGSVSDGGTIACDYAGGATAGTGTCSASILEGTNVTLTATPDGSSELLEWGGCTAGVDPLTCTVTMNADTNVTARFVSSTTTDATVTITSVDDIGEEYLDGASTATYSAPGAVGTGTGFTELTYSTRWSSDQAVGLRFPNVNIPVGAVIESATITFTSNAGTAQGTADALALTVDVYGQGDVAPDPFLDTAVDGAAALHNVTDRLVGATPATVWSIPATAWAVGSTHAVDVKDIVGDIIGLDGWNPGSNAIAFVLQNSQVGTSAVQDGRRLVNNTSTSGAPVLTVTYR